MALTADRNTPMMDGELVDLPLAAVKVFAGGIAVLNASGFVTKGAVATTLIYLGRFESTVDNSAGNAGDKTVSVRKRKAFKWKNSGADAVVQADVGKLCYIVDDETVAKTNGTNTRSAAGTVIKLDSDGVWVL